MQRRNVKKIGRVTACAISAVVLFSGMNLDILAKEANGLPSAGIDFFLSSNATSVKSLKDDETENTDEDAETEFSAATAAPTATAAPIEKQEEEKIIEETMMASTTKTINQKERELEA
ncbi:MAG: hypothetical protein K2M81_03525, partial [Lachnospiraceae bacterium]|nr:hypothetical protein [Lachnospiraceae bacterium]